jgi:hypothetical protein
MTRRSTALLFNGASTRKSIFVWILKTLLIAIMTGMVLELGPFNGLHWMMMLEKGKRVSFTTGTGIEKISKSTYQIVNQNDANIIVKDINRQVSTLHLPMTTDSPILNLSISASDSANESGAVLSDTRVQISSLYSPSEYLPTHFRNEVKDISINLGQNGVGTLFEMGNIGINVCPPLSLSRSRVLFNAIIALIVLSLVPSSALWRIPLFSNENGCPVLHIYSKNLAIGCALFGCCIFFLVVDLHSSFNSIFNSTFYDSKSGTMIFHTQFACLARSLIRGRVDLDLPVATYLKSMTNPYDPSARIANAIRTGDAFYLDAAYRDGKYYCYFGILPILLTYLPYLVIFGKDMPNIYAIIIFGVGFIASLNYLSIQIVKRFAPTAPLGAYVVTSIVLLCSSGFAFWSTTLSYYTIPIVSALAFGGMGLALLIKASMHSESEISKKQLMLGALFIALTVGCRPQFVLLGLLAIPIFWDDIIYRRIFFSKKGFWNTVLFFLPFAFVAILQFAYNYLRFGSIFDFGASYNLTGNDMTSRGFVASRIPLGLFSYIFQPFTVSPAFPFFSTANLNNNYVGLTSHEDIYAGLLFTSPVILLSILLCKPNVQRARTKDSWRFFVWTVVLTSLILIIDIEASGIVERYKSDFGWIISMGSISMLLDYSKGSFNQSVEIQPKSRRDDCACAIRLLSIAAIATAFATVACVLMAGKAVSLESVNPKFYSVLLTAVRYAFG